MTFDKSNESQHQTHEVRHNGQFRRFLAQFLATSVKNMLLFNMGLYVSFSGIVIPAVTGILNEHNQNETLALTSSQASWLGSIGYIFEPLGCILSALITDPLGRRSAMLFVNVPLVIAWFMLYNASSTIEVFIAFSLLGLGVGLMESPVITYIGEICEPRYRGVMIAYSAVTGTLGMFFVFILNTLMPWRMAALICMFIPILTVVALCFVPETPLWLLSKNKTLKAEKSLCWLRGWVSRDVIADEFHSLQRYSERSKSCPSCIKQNEQCPHPLPTMVEKLVEMKRKQTLKPFFIIMSLFLIAQFSGIAGMTPFIVQIFKAYESPVAPDRTAALVSFVNNIGNIAFLCLLRFTGKRRLYLVMLSGVFLSAIVVCGYGFIVLPGDFNSFDRADSSVLENSQLGYIPFIAIILWSGFSFCGVNSLPWQMLSEIFPFKTRGMATGISAALSYVLIFIATKSYYNLETSLSLPGVALFNCVVIAFGLVLMYYVLPETENRTLEDIELHFSDNSKKFTDRNIPKMKSKQKTVRNGRDSSELPTRPASVARESDEVIKENRPNGCDNRGFVNGT